MKLEMWLPCPKDYLHQPLHILTVTQQVPDAYCKTEELPFTELYCNLQYFATATK